jgi:lipopolysaccharide/colanic/teichoic acid biosynthesis glycosyltransferase
MKRLVALLLLIMLSPVLLVVAGLVRWRLGNPVLFRQQRPGYKGKLFTMLKFRTMRDAVDERGNSLPDAKRLTRLGRWLRSTSLDELPEMWNIARGDMAFVGPRPLLSTYMPLYNDEQRRRHDVLPGVTGWAQVNGRNAITWEKKFELDIWYVDHRSFLLDCRILAMTIWKVVSREGISATGEATMAPFTGRQHKV